MYNDYDYDCDDYDCDYNDDTIIIEDGDGHILTAGLQPHSAYSVAESLADDRGEPVYLIWGTEAVYQIATDGQSVEGHRLPCGTWAAR